MVKKVNKAPKRLSPYVIVVLSFLTIIVIGTSLLLLPFATKTREILKFSDALFLATSATTVTGLVPKTLIIPNLSIFGKLVILLLMEIGGFSVITISVFILTLFGAKIGITNRVIIRENLNSDTLGGIIKLLRRIVKYSLLIQLVGFIINLFVFSRSFTFGEAVLSSALFTVSSFNNVGFDLLYDTAIVNIATTPLFAINTILLIILGGIGMIVLFEVIDKHKWQKFSVHTKVVLMMNVFLWIFGVFALKLGQNGVNSLSWMEATLLSVSARTAGTNVYNISLLSNFSTFVIILLMFIGGSPTSTTGGLKTTTFFTLVQSLFSYSTGSEKHVGKRRISDTAKHKAFLLFFVFVFLIILASLLILLFTNIAIGDTLFIVTSAATNTGYSTLPIETLNSGAQITLIFTMFIGRIGPLTFLSIFNRRWAQKESDDFAYLAENIVIG